MRHAFRLHGRLVTIQPASQPLFAAPPDLRVAALDSKWMVLNPRVPAWLTTNAAGVTLIKLCDGVRTTDAILREFAASCRGVPPSTAREFLEHAARIGVFTTAPPPKAYRPTGLRSIHLNVTDACSLRCVYCYAEDRARRAVSLPVEAYHSLLEEIAEHFGPEVGLTFTGGEPLLFEGIFDVAARAKQMGFSTSLLTNATKITPENAPRVAGSFDEIKISLDGAVPEINDQTRGSGSFDRITAGMACLDRVGKPYTLSMTVTRANKDGVQAMCERYGNRLGLAPYFLTGDDRKVNERLWLTGAEYYEAVTSFGDLSPFVGIGTIVASLAASHAIQRCAMGDGSMSIASNGDVFPCHLLHTEEFLCGNILERPFHAIYRESPVLLKLRKQTVDTMAGCRECAIRYLCGGACLARHYRETGDICQAGSFCEYEQMAIPHALLATQELHPFHPLGSSSS